MKVDDEIVRIKMKKFEVRDEEVEVEEESADLTQGNSFSQGD